MALVENLGLLTSCTSWGLRSGMWTRLIARRVWGPSSSGNLLVHKNHTPQEKRLQSSLANVRPRNATYCRSQIVSMFDSLKHWCTQATMHENACRWRITLYPKKELESVGTVSIVQRAGPQINVSLGLCVRAPGECLLDPLIQEIYRRVSELLGTQLGAMGWALKKASKRNRSFQRCCDARHSASKLWIHRVPGMRKGEVEVEWVSQQFLRRRCSALVVLICWDPFFPQFALRVWQFPLKTLSFLSRYQQRAGT